VLERLWGQQHLYWSAFRPAHCCLHIRLFYLCPAVPFFPGPKSLQQCTTYWGNFWDWQQLSWFCHSVLPVAILSCYVSIQLDRSTCSSRPIYTFSFSVMTSTTLCQLLVQWEGKHAAQPCCSAVCCKRYTSDNELAKALCRHCDMVRLSLHSLYACPSSVSVMQLWYRANANIWGWSQETFYASVIEPQNAWLRMLTCWAWCMLERDWRLYLDSIILSLDTVVHAQVKIYDCIVPTCT